MTDKNAKLIYAVENRLWVGAKFSTREEMQEYADLVTASEFWQKIQRTHCHVPARVKVFSLGDEGFSEIRDPDELWMTEEHWHQQAILHELAHWAFNERSHEPSFVSGYLRLLREFMGVSVARMYADAFRQNGVTTRE